MKAFRGGIIRMFEQGKSGYQISQDMNLHARTVNRIIKRYQETESYSDRQRSGRPRTVRTPANKRKIKGRIQRSPVKAWNSIPQDIIDKALDDFLKRLKKCIEAGGGHFENK
uniref:Paired domain-containing protein n=1 Tax=Acrobeloides nanus TaxID=290746 RepID=A0A914C2W4_9BILA